MSVAASRKIEKSEANASGTTDSMLWPEWSDVALNKENWATPKNGSDGLFLDTQLAQLPQSLKAHEWIRAKELTNLTIPLTVFNPNLDNPDLITNNKHLLHSEFVRWFISAIINLQYCGRNGLEASGENNNFVWNGRRQPWRGWMNVYSMNKAGKDIRHQPNVNPNGKYIVRLYFLGFWRRVTVDDMIPVDEEGVPLLPRTENNSELWPMILAKGLLKLCSLTWSQHREIVDMHPVACLTGWVSLYLDIGYLSPQDKWDFVRKYAEHFEWEAEEESQKATRIEADSEGKKSKKKSRDTSQSKKSKSTNASEKSETTGRSKKSKDTKKTKDSVKQLKVPTKPEPVTLCLGLGDMRTPSEAVPGLSPCWSHFIHIVQSRDVPLDPNDVKPPLARWKLFRWLRWAIEEGMIDPVEYFVPIRSLKVVSSLKEHDESVINRYSDGNLEMNTEGEKSNRVSVVEHDGGKKKPSVASGGTLGKVLVENSSKDISFWADFNKMEPYITNIHFFYKLDYFQYTARISDSPINKKQRDQRSEKKESKKGSRKSSPSGTTSREPAFTDSYCWPQKMSKSRNEPIYIFTDSLEEKFFLINFSTFQVSVNQHNNESKESIVSTASDDYLTIEKHSLFYRPNTSPCLVLISTAGTMSKVMELEPGRYLLRMYCHSESCCFMTISSDTAFHLGDLRRMYQLMSMESERIDQIAKHISNTASLAFQSFGTANYLEAMRTYYKSYMPPNGTINKRKLFYDQIHGCYMEEKVKLIRDILPTDEAAAIIRSLRIFYLNRIIGLECYNAIRMMLKTLREIGWFGAGYATKLYGKSDEGVPNENYAAIIIQSYFKKLTIKKYKTMHDPNHKEHQEVLRNLLKLVELFNYNKRESIANRLLKNMLKNHGELYNMYPCSKDIEYTIQIQELTGKLANISPNQWVPITRFMINPPLVGSGPTAFDLLVSLPKHSLRVFNNQTRREMMRVVNNVVPFRYQRDTLGYTVFGYGWSEDQEFKELPWTMYIITIKGQPMMHLLNDEAPICTTSVLPTLMTEELSYNYIPNKRKHVSKWIIRVTKPSIVSLRLRTSYDHVKIKFRLMTKEKYLLSEVQGISAVIMPAVYLGTDKDIDPKYFGRRVRSIYTEKNSILIGVIDNEENLASFANLVNGNEEDEEDEESVNSQIYYAEAFVLENSWPLTKSEWAVVTDIRILPSGSITRLKPSVSLSSMNINKPFKTDLSKKKASKTSIDTQALNAPYWVLQVVLDSDSDVEVFEDRTKWLEIARMKETWAKENPDSLQRGKEYRKVFLKENELKSEPSDLEFMYESSPSSTSEIRSVTSLVKKKSSSLSKRSSKRDSAQTSVNCLELLKLTLEKRTLKPTPSLRRVPALNLLIYKVPDEEEDVQWFKTEADEETLRMSRGMNIIYAQEDYCNVLEDFQKLINNEKDKCRMLYSEHEESFRERRDSFENAYETRQAYIDSMKPLTARSGSKKSTKSKKTKKSKKV